MKKIGMRNIKTGIAVFLATLAAYVGIIKTPMYTVSVCIFSIKSTVKDSLESSISRILGTLLGGLFGYLFTLAVNRNILFTALGVIITIHLCKIFKISDSAGIASVTFAAILLGVDSNDPLKYSILRTFDTLVGVLIALVVNFWISRKTYLNYLFMEFNNTHSECKILIDSMRRNKSYTSYSELNSKFNILENYYNQLIDEFVYSNEQGDLDNITLCFEIWEQLLHHINGLNLMEQNKVSLPTLEKETVYNYHINNISILLKMIDNIENLTSINKNVA